MVMSFAVALTLAAVVLLGVAAVVPATFWPPAAVSVDGSRLVVRLRGPYKVFALRSTVSVPLASVRAARVESDARHLPRGIRVGTYVPGGTIAGSFGTGARRAFWAVQGREAVVVDLAGEPFSRIVVEVRDPDETAAAITAASR